MITWSVPDMIFGAFILILIQVAAGFFLLGWELCLCSPDEEDDEE